MPVFDACTSGRRVSTARTREERETPFTRGTGEQVSNFGCVDVGEDERLGPDHEVEVAAPGECDGFFGGVAYRLVTVLRVPLHLERIVRLKETDLERVR